MHENLGAGAISVFVYVVITHVLLTMMHSRLNERTTGSQPV